MTGTQTIESLTTLTQRPELAFFDLQHLSVICIQGPQAIDFLQGQLTCDVIGLSHQEWVWGAHCDAKGKMVASFRIMKRDDALYLLIPKSLAPLHEMHLKKYAVFHQVEIHTLQARIIGIEGTHAFSWLQEQDFLADTKVKHYDSGFVLQDVERAILIHFSQDALPPQMQHVNINNTYAHWQGLEILSGYPLFEAQSQGQFIPQMMNLDTLGGISLTKGCYIGQETVARMTYRGGNNRGLFVLVGTCSTTRSLHDALEMKMDAGYRKAGDALQLYQSGDQCALTLVLRKDTDLHAEFRFVDDPASSLRIMPLSTTKQES